MKLLFIFLTVPPEACFETFRWDDCGGEPVRVLYYWKPGSRCEVGIWRGCLPNMNMFKNEYECVATCIFTARAEPRDYHNLNEEDRTLRSLGSNEENVTETATILTNHTIAQSTNKTMNSTASYGNLTTIVGGNGTAAKNDTGPTKLKQLLSTKSIARNPQGPRQGFQTKSTGHIRNFS